MPIILKRLIGLGFLFLTTSICFSQDKIIFLGGGEIDCKIEEVNEEGLTYRKQNKKKTKFVDIDGVFAIIYENQPAKIIYKPDSINGYNLSIREMRMFINGAQDAKKNFKAPFALISSFAVGATVHIYIPNAFFGLLVPATYTVLTGLTQPKIKRKHVSNANYLLEETYILGYRRTAKNIKIQNSVMGGAAGFVIGLFVVPLL